MSNNGSENSLPGFKAQMPSQTSQSGLPAAVGHSLLKLIRLYTFNSPLRKGKLTLANFGMRFSGFQKAGEIVPTVDGRRLYADLSTGMCLTLFFLGEYERSVTRIIEAVVHRGDVCLDVGANFGWYTTRLHQLCGPEGAVHAFEPVPQTFAILEKNIALIEKSDNIHINNVALGDVPGKVEMHIFAGLPNGHSSISAMGREDYATVESPLITLDSYMEEKLLERVDFVKVDIEGAELMFFKGAGRLFAQKVPPIWMIEMALGTTKGFGYLPDELVRYMKERADYRFYAVNEIKGTLTQIEGFAADDIGANVLCLPAEHYGKRFAQARIQSLIASD